MKRFNNYLPIIVLLWGLLLAGCKSNVGEEPDPNPPAVKEPPITNTGQANQISENLILKNARLISGTLPTNANLSDLKIDKETLNLWPGIKNRIRILNIDAVSISSILVHIQGTDSYYEVPVETDESNDTSSVFYIDIDPDGLELPLDHSITIAPVGPDGQVIDTAGDSLHVDPPFDESTGGGGPDPGTTKPALNEALFWIYTEQNGVFVNAPGFRQLGSYETRGCCINGVSSTRCTDYDKLVVVNDQWSEITEEVIKFTEGSDDFAYILERSFNDYDPKKTDFCAGRPGYSDRSSGIATAGSYSMSPANGFETFYEITIENIQFTLDDALNLGYGPFTAVNAQNLDFEYYLGSHFYVERLNIEGSVILRVFEVVPADVAKWYD